MNISATKKRIANMPDLNEFMTTQEAAKKLGFNVKSIPKMLRDGVLKGERFGRAWLVSRKSLDEYISNTIGMGKRDRRYKEKNKSNN